MTYPLEDLLSPNIQQPAIQVPHLLHNIINLALICALDLARLANRHVQVELDSAVYTSVAQPSSARLDILGCEAESVLA
jgi:hypothetical protein